MIINTRSTAVEFTLTGGTGVTIPNSYQNDNAAAIGGNENGKYLAVVTNVSSGSEAVTIYPTKVSQY